MVTNRKPVVMITGAAGGFGTELIRQFRQNGYQIFATARTLPKNVESEDFWHKLDVSVYEQCAEAMGAGFERFGHIDVLINNASAYIGGVTLTEISKEDIDAELNTTLRGAIYLSKLYVEHARKQKSGKVIFISSIAGLDGEPDCALYSVYAAAKAGMIRFAECFNEDIQQFGMQAHVVVPGGMRATTDESELAAQNSISYKKAAQFVMEIANGSNNLSLSQSILRPIVTSESSK